MRIVTTIDASWIKDLIKMAGHPDVEKFILAEETIEDVVLRITEGQVVWLGLEDGSWRGFATLEPHGDQAELTLFAPGRARQAVDVISRLLERYPISKIYMKVQADRLGKWESYNKKDWERITRFWGLEFVGIVGDPIGNKPYQILAAKEIKHGTERTVEPLSGADDRQLGQYRTDAG